MSNKAENLTEGRKLLIDWFVALKLDKDTTLGIMSMLDTEEKERDMLNFLSMKIKPTEQEILQKLKEIVEEN